MFTKQQINKVEAGVINTEVTAKIFIRSTSINIYFQNPESANKFRANLLVTTKLVVSSVVRSVNVKTGKILHGVTISEIRDSKRTVQKS